MRGVDPSRPRSTPGPEGPEARPRIGVTLGDPRGIGPEVVGAALGREDVRHLGRFVLFGPPEVAPDPADGVDLVEVGSWPGGPGKSGAGRGEVAAGRAAGAAVEEAIEAAIAGRVDGLVTAPLSKRALRAAGWDFPGHTELLARRTGVRDVTMMMAAETTPLGGPLRLGLLTAHVALRRVSEILDRELVVRRSLLAVRALQGWWGIPEPRLSFAGVNPHASESGLFGDEEARILEPAVRQLAAEPDLEVDGVHPADTVFRRCIDGRVDAVMVPYHDVGLAVLKTLALEEGVNVTAGLPFPRTSPDHGTAFDIAGQGRADPRSMVAALELCARFCRATSRIRTAGASPEQEGS